MQETKQRLLEILKEIKNGDLTKSVLKLIELYKVSAAESRELIRNSINNKIAGQLLSFSYSAAIESVRKKSEEILLNGIVAQSIENAQKDYRDNVVLLFLLYNSAKKIGVDFPSLINETANLSSPDFADLISNFIKRNDLDSDLVKLSGYKMVTEPEFNYVWVG